MREYRNFARLSFHVIEVARPGVGGRNSFVASAGRLVVFDEDQQTQKAWTLRGPSCNLKTMDTTTLLVIVLVVLLLGGGGFYFRGRR